jgi:hypothetical protein
MSGDHHAGMRSGIGPCANSLSPTERDLDASSSSDWSQVVGGIASFRWCYMNNQTWHRALAQREVERACWSPFF